MPLSPNAIQIKWANAVGIAVIHINALRISVYLHLCDESHKSVWQRHEVWQWRERSKRKRARRRERASRYTKNLHIFSFRKSSLLILSMLQSIIRWMESKTDSKNTITIERVLPCWHYVNNELVCTHRIPF